MKKERLREVYFVDNPEKILDDESKNLLMCSTKNWNHYFEKLSDESRKRVDSLEKIEDLNLVKFNSEKEMFDYIDKKDDWLIIDWSLEHREPMLLELVEV